MTARGLLEIKEHEGKNLVFCAKCGHHWEIPKNESPKERECPKCGMEVLGIGKR